MNKRPHPGGLGLPAKPYTPSQAGPAPPLPAGQPPQQQPQYTQDQQAAHAAAWAAYYQVSLRRAATAEESEWDAIIFAPLHTSHLSPR